MSVERRSNTLADLAGSGRNRLTLEPLRQQGADAITPSHIPGLIRVTLTEIQFSWENVFHPGVAYMADDLFQSGALEDPVCALIPACAIITKAVFHFFFADAPETPRPVAFSPPFTMELARQSDADTVQRWATLHGFIAQIESRSESGEQAVVSA